MNYGTIISQGNFVSDGTPKILLLPQGVDFVRTINMTAAAGAVQDASPFSMWQVGMADNDCYYVYHNAATQVLSASTCAVGPEHAPAAIPGYHLVNSAFDAQVTAPRAITAISNVGVVSTNNTTGLVANQSFVRISSANGAAELAGIDFLVTAVNPGVSFTLGTLIAAGNIVAAPAPGANAVYRQVIFDAGWYPPYRVITNITRAPQAVVTTSVDHRYIVGQEVRFQVPNIPNFNTMYEINGLIGEIVATPTPTTFTVNINTTAFTAFAFPADGNSPFSPALVIPVGEGTDSTIANPNLLDDATTDVNFSGIVLNAGRGSPAGENGDVIFWVAGKLLP